MSVMIGSWWVSCCSHWPKAEEARARPAVAL
jgi:hypothetical protein